MDSSQTQLLLDILSIVLIDLLLSGDNAVVIAMAVKSLPARERKIGILVGASMAVVLRLVLTFFLSKLLDVSFVKLAGGLLLLYVAVRLMASDETAKAGDKRARSLWQAMVYIVIADVTMSTDNILAIAAVSGGDTRLLLFGLGLSIPLVLFTSNLLSSIMDKYPVVVLIGAAVLGRVAGDMILSDPWIDTLFHEPVWVNYLAQAMCAVGVVIIGRRMGRQEARKLAGQHIP
jgi:YjbE family integral membrane protein